MRSRHNAPFTKCSETGRNGDLDNLELTSYVCCEISCIAVDELV